jgi:hypothetical protein
LAVRSENGGLGKVQELSAGKVFGTKDRMGLRQ